MKYKNLIEENFETILTEGRLTPPPPPPRASTTLLPAFPAPTAPTRQRCIYEEDRGELEKTHAQRIQLKHVVPKHVNERVVVLLLLVLFQL